MLVCEVPCRRPVLLLAVELDDGRLVWSTTRDVEEGACWLRKSDAAAVRLVERRERGNLWIRVVRRAEAVELLRLARAGALRDLRGRRR
jgi:hypothetical protein